MDRLTKRLPNGEGIMDCQKCENSWCTKHPGQKRGDCTALYCRNRLKDRMAEYEDIIEQLENRGFPLEKLVGVIDLLVASGFTVASLDSAASSTDPDAMRAEYSIKDLNPRPNPYTSTFSKK